LFIEPAVTVPIELGQSHSTPTPAITLPFRLIGLLSVSLTGSKERQGQNYRRKEIPHRVSSLSNYRGAQADPGIADQHKLKEPFPLLPFNTGPCDGFRSVRSAPGKLSFLS
jgi:hypothetical protein